ncbi:MAG: hypothetical protein ACXWIH_18275 [Burkholderiales bacterium]
MSSTVTFTGKSGERYCFQAWPMDTKFKAIAGVYVITKRSFEDRTFQTRASHTSLGIGQTNNLGVLLATKSDRTKVSLPGANCICVCAVADETRRAEMEKDLIEGNECGGMHYLVHLPVPEKAPGAGSIEA